jgi:hypothetical protein
MPSPVTGQVQVSATPQALATTHIEATAWVLKAPSTNAGPVYVGAAAVTAGTGHQYDPGDSFEYERSSQNGAPKYQISPDDIYVVGTSGDRVTWFASP